MSKLIHYWHRYDSKKKVWVVVGKRNSDRGYCLEVEFKYEIDAINEVNYLTFPERRPKE